MQNLSAVRNAPSLGGRFRVLPQLPPRNESGGRWSHAPAGRNKPANGRISARRLHLPTKAKAALAVCLLSIGRDAPAGDHYSGYPRPPPTQALKARPPASDTTFNGSLVHNCFPTGKRVGIHERRGYRRHRDRARARRSRGRRRRPAARDGAARQVAPGRRGPDPPRAGRPAGAGQGRIRRARGAPGPPREGAGQARGLDHGQRGHRRRRPPQQPRSRGARARPRRPRGRAGADGR